MDNAQKWEKLYEYVKHEYDYYKITNNKNMMKAYRKVLLKMNELNNAGKETVAWTRESNMK